MFFFCDFSGFFLTSFSFLSIFRDFDFHDFFFFADFFFVMSFLCKCNQNCNCYPYCNCNLDCNCNKKKGHVNSGPVKLSNFKFSELVFHKKWQRQFDLVWEVGLLLWELPPVGSPF